MVSAMRLQISKPQVIFEVFDDEVVIVNLTTGNYYTVAKIGADIWGLLSKSASAAEIVQWIADRYEADRGDMEKAVQTFLAALQQADLVSAAPANEPEGTDSGPVDSAPRTPRTVFAVPLLEEYTDMQGLLLLDPVHEVDETGWPHVKGDAGQK